jgi:Peptidase M16 inactive domain.
MGGISKMPYDVLMSYLYENNISINLAISNYWHTIMGMFSDDKAKEFFNLVYEKIHYPELCYEDFSGIKKEEIKNLNNENLLSQLIKRDPNRLITNKLDSLVGNAVKGSFYERKIEDIQNINLDSIANYYTNLFSNSNNLNILVTGDFKIDKIKDYLISTFGSMEKRKEDYKIDSYNNLPTKNIFRNLKK